jgi:hypothetical protein
MEKKYREIAELLIFLKTVEKRMSGAFQPIESPNRKYIINHLAIG